MPLECAICWEPLGQLMDDKATIAAWALWLPSFSFMRFLLPHSRGKLPSSPQLPPWPICLPFILHHPVFSTLNSVSETSVTVPLTNHAENPLVTTLQPQPSIPFVHTLPPAYPSSPAWPGRKAKAHSLRVSALEDPENTVARKEDLQMPKGIHSPAKLSGRQHGIRAEDL